MASAPEILLQRKLNRHGEPLHEQLYTRVRRAIVEGRLGPGDRLPSSRSMASELAVARGTVETAYARLAGEGYVLARGPAGTVVSPDLHTEIRLPRPKPRREIGLGDAPSVQQPRPFELGLPAMDMFPRSLWARLSARVARGIGGASLAYPEPLGFHRLRTALATYLAVSRGVVCKPEQVIVTGGYQAALNLLCRTLLEPQDKVWFEEPGYFLARAALQAAGVELVPIPVDDDGIRVDLAEACAPEARLAVVTPAHHSPLGVSLSLPRRQALLAWANKSGAWIVEDEYDSEFHYVGRKLPALKSLDAADRVIYAGSFSKTLFPSLRLGYLVVPEALVGCLADAARTACLGVPILGQMVAAEFICEGHFARHLKRMRTLYAARRAAFADALATTFGEEIELSLQRGGMSLVLRFRDPITDVDLVQRALTHGLAPTALSDQYMGDRRENGLLLGFTNIPESEAARCAHDLRRALNVANGGSNGWKRNMGPNRKLAPENGTNSPGADLPHLSR